MEPQLEFQEKGLLSHPFSKPGQGWGTEQNLSDCGGHTIVYIDGSAGDLVA